LRKLKDARDVKKSPETARVAGDSPEIRRKVKRLRERDERMRGREEEKWCTRENEGEGGLFLI